jgi:hypothetical protein
MAIGRNVSNPYLNVRYRENNSFGSWNKISAGYSDTAGSCSTCTGNANTSSSCTGNANTSSSCTGNANTSSSCTGNANTSSSCTGNANTCNNFLGTPGITVNSVEASGVVWLAEGTSCRYFPNGSSNVDYGYYNGTYYNDGNLLPGIVSDYSIWTKKSLFASSDIRIKKNIIDIDDDKALQKILAIEPKTYNYIDITRGDNLIFGFIAQQIKEVVPEAVSLCNEYIPNIYSVCDVSSNIITLNTLNLHGLNINYSDVNLQLNTDIKIYDVNDKEIKCKITNINNNIITIDSNLDGNKCIVYGTKINDFHTLDKNYIFTLNVCATQDLYKLMQQQNTIIQDLLNRISILEEKISRI